MSELRPENYAIMTHVGMLLPSPKGGQQHPNVCLFEFSPGFTVGGNSKDSGGKNRAAYIYIYGSSPADGRFFNRFTPSFLQKIARRGLLKMGRGDPLDLFQIRSSNCKLVQKSGLKSLENSQK